MPPTPWELSDGEAQADLQAGSIRLEINLRPRRTRARPHPVHVTLILEGASLPDGGWRPGARLRFERGTLWRGHDMTLYASASVRGEVEVLQLQEGRPLVSLVAQAASPDTDLDHVGPVEVRGVLEVTPAAP